MQSENLDSTAGCENGRLLKFGVWPVLPLPRSTPFSSRRATPKPGTAGQQMRSMAGGARCGAASRPAAKSLCHHGAVNHWHGSWQSAAASSRSCRIGCCCAGACGAHARGGGRQVSVPNYRGHARRAAATPSATHAPAAPSGLDAAQRACTGRLQPPACLPAAPSLRVHASLALVLVSGAHQIGTAPTHARHPTIQRPAPAAPCCPHTVDTSVA